VQKQKHSTHEHVQAKHFVEDMGDKKNVWKDIWEWNGARCATKLNVWKV
jgi:hypothetical protein